MAVVVNRRAHAIATVVILVVLLALAVIWVFPYVMLLLTSVKSQGFLLKHSIFALPDKIYLSNFVDAFVSAGLGRFVKNSFLISVVKVPIGILVAALAAYSISKHSFRGRRMLYFYFVIGLAIPIQVTLLPLNILLRDLHLLNSLAALFFPYIAFGLPFQIMVMRGFFLTVPNELVDAARIDGSSEARIFVSIMMPLAVSALAALVILDFLATWNEFLMALIFIQSPRNETLPLGLLYFQGQYSTRWNLLCAGVVLGILPVLVVYFALQRYFTAGIYSGAVKQ
ncbi:MAG TPA: carbohydrate ABC transporter permease [Spirochaetia bacterium]|nr:carbohydrate ABC transporter permease [Spirochaetia bacterium]